MLILLLEFVLMYWTPCMLYASTFLVWDTQAEGMP